MYDSAAFCLKMNEPSQKCVKKKTTVILLYLLAAGRFDHSEKCVTLQNVFFSAGPLYGNDDGGKKK